MSRFLNRKMEPVMLGVKRHAWVRRSKRPVTGDPKSGTLKMLYGLGVLVMLLGVLAVALLVGDLRANQTAKTVATPVNAVPTMNCGLVVPDAPLTAAGLATPWQLLAPCHESSPNQAVFVQADIIDIDTGQITAYSPLVIDAGSKPAVVPQAPTLPQRHIVAMFGGGGDTITTLSGAGALQCDNGAVGKKFGQVFFCGAQGFFDAAKHAIRLGQLVVPPLGVESLGGVPDGLPCPTVRDFRIVDQDQSDNTTTTYLLVHGGQTAQNTASNRALLAAAGGFTIQGNGSDNKLLTHFVDPAVGCKPWTVPDLTDNGAPVATQATDELQAAMFQASPVALVPAGDEMVGPNVLAMINTYRLDVDQPRAASLADASTQVYCENLSETATSWITFHAIDFQGASPTAGMTLEAFLLDRLATARMVLGCTV